MPKKQNKVKVKSSSNSRGFFAKLKQMPLVAKILIVVVVVAGIGGTATYFYSKQNQSDLSVEALDATYALTRWKKLGESTGRTGSYKFYACQHIAPGGKHYIRAIAVKPKQKKFGPDTVNKPIRVAVVTFWSDRVTSGENGVADNRNGSGPYDFAFWGDEISAPSALVEKDGWWQAKFGGNGNIHQPEGGTAPHTFAKISALFTPGCTPYDQAYLDKQRVENIEASQRAQAARRAAEEEARRLAEEARLREEEAERQKWVNVGRYVEIAEQQKRQNAIEKVRNALTKSFKNLW